MVDSTPAKKRRFQVDTIGVLVALGWLILWLAAIGSMQWVEHHLSDAPPVFLGYVLGYAILVFGAPMAAIFAVFWSYPLSVVVAGMSAFLFGTCAWVTWSQSCTPVLLPPHLAALEVTLAVTAVLTLIGIPMASISYAKGDRLPAYVVGIAWSFFVGNLILIGGLGTR